MIKQYFEKFIWLWNEKSWDKVESKEYRVSEVNEKSKEIQRNRVVMRMGQEKETGQEKRTTMVKLMGLAVPSLNINIELMGLAMPPLTFSFENYSFY